MSRRAVRHFGLWAIILGLSACGHRAAALDAPLTPLSPASAANDAEAPDLPTPSSDTAQNASEAESVAALEVAPETLAEPPVEPPRPIRVPEGCEWNFSGMYRLGSDRLAAAHAPVRLYRVVDDGLVARLSPDDAPGEATGAEALFIEFTRSPDGFVGVLRQKAQIDGGQTCEVTLNARLLACELGKRLRLSLEDSVDIDGRCEVIERGESREVELWRVIR